MFLSLLLDYLVPFGVVLFVLRYAMRQASLRPKYRESPVLLIQSTQGEVLHGHQGITPAGASYTYLIGSANLFSNDKTAGIYAVYLPFKTAAHLLGLPRNDSAIRVQTRGSSMEPVDLEGNYSQYFRLYADRGQQTDSRYVLDPAAMVFTIDFCQKFSWEIANNTLYFYSNDQLPSFAVADRFIEEIRPAIELPASKNYAQIPYTPAPVLRLSCPICQTGLVNGDAWMECPQQHGFLITGRQLRGHREKIVAVDKSVKYIDGRTKKLQCPHCAHDMLPSQFQDSHIIIDRCSRCVYRWIDAPEARGVLGIQAPKVS